MATWPSDLPQRPLRGTATQSPGSARVSSKPEYGPRLYRRRFTAAEDPTGGTYRMTFAQWDTLLTFFKTDTKHGAISFDFPDPITGNTVTAKFAQPPEISDQPVPDRVNVDIRVYKQP